MRAFERIFHFLAWALRVLTDCFLLIPHRVVGEMRAWASIWTFGQTCGGQIDDLGRFADGLVL